MKFKKWFYIVFLNEEAYFNVLSIHFFDALTYSWGFDDVSIELAHYKNIKPLYLFIQA